jgi:PAS domain S-box-containing protein
MKTNDKNKNSKSNEEKDGNPQKFKHFQSDTERESYIKQQQQNKEYKELLKTRIRSQIIENNYLQLFELHPHPLLKINSEGKILGVNDKALQLLQQNKENLVGKTLSELDFIISPTRLTPFLTSLFQTRSQVSIPVELNFNFTPNSYLLEKLLIEKGVDRADQCIVTIKPFPVTSQPSEFKLPEKNEKFNQENKFQILSNHLPALIWTTDINKKINYINQQWINYTGKKSDLRGDGWFNYIHPKDQPKIKAFFDNHSCTVKLEEELQLKRYDGEYRYFYIIIVPSFSKTEKKFLGYIGTCVDINDRKEIENALRDKESQYRLIAENMLDMVCVQDINGIYHYVSPSAKEVLGYSPEELIGTNVSHLIHPDDIERVLQAKNNLISGKAQEKIICRKKRKDGGYKWFETISKPVFDQQKKFIHFHTSSRDITTRKQTEQALFENERKFRLIAENMQDFVHLINPEGEFCYVSPSVKELLGYEPNELNGKQIFSIIHPQEKDFATKCIHKSISASTEMRISLRFKKKTGQYVWYESLSKPVIDEEGNIKGLQTSSRDISIRKKAVTQLRESEERYRLIAENMRDLITLHNPDGSFKYVSPSVKELLGYTPEEMLGKLPTDFSNENDIQLLKKALISGLKRTSKSPIEYRMKKKNGEEVWLETLIQPSISYTERVSEIQAVSRDITERKMVREALRNAYDQLELKVQERTSALANANQRLQRKIKEHQRLEQKYLREKEISNFTINSLPGLFYIVDQEGKLIRWNKNLEKVTEYSSEEIIQMNAISFFQEQDRPFILRNIKQVLVFGQHNCEGGLKTKSGNIIPYFFSGFFMSIDAHQYVIGIGMDISERKKAEEAVKSQANQLQIQNENQNKFFSIIAHDLRSPFTGLIGFSHFLSERIEMLSQDEIKAYAANINMLANKFQKLVTNLLKWASIQLGTIDFQPTKVELNNAINDNIHLLQSNAETKGVGLFNEVEPGLFVKADENMLQSILQNLISNAIKFTRKGDTISISATPQNNTIEISVTDTGIGMSSEIQKTIFDINTKHTTKGTANETGTGLGLILCKEFVEKQGGNIWVESQPGKGSSFKFILPKYN